MILGQKSLEKLRLLINEETEYRSGPQLVQFFNRLGFSSSYGQGFPSRWVYTDGCLEKINGTPEIDKCILNVLSPANFIGKAEDLDKHINDFNQYLTFDKWKVVRNGAELKFKRLDKIQFDETPTSVSAEDEFLSREFADVSVDRLGLESSISAVLQERISEIEKAFAADAYLSVILLAGSTLEGIFLGLATKYPSKFNSCSISPKYKDGKVKKFPDWSLAGFIDVAGNLGLIQLDTKKFSHTIRDFRNYIHPFEQMSSGFSPRKQTAKICLQVLKAVIYEICENLFKIRT